MNIQYAENGDYNYPSYQSYGQNPTQNSKSRKRCFDNNGGCLTPLSITLCIICSICTAAVILGVVLGLIPVYLAAINKSSSGAVSTATTTVAAENLATVAATTGRLFGAARGNFDDIESIIVGIILSTFAGASVKPRWRDNIMGADITSVAQLPPWQASSYKFDTDDFKGKLGTALDKQKTQIEAKAPPGYKATVDSSKISCVGKTTIKNPDGSESTDNNNQTTTSNSNTTAGVTTGVTTTGASGNATSSGNSSSSNETTTPSGSTVSGATGASSGASDATTHAESSGSSGVSGSTTPNSSGASGQSTTPGGSSSDSATTMQSGSVTSGQSTTPNESGTSGQSTSPNGSGTSGQSTSPSGSVTSGQSTTPNQSGTSGQSTTPNESGTSGQGTSPNGSGTSTNPTS